MEAVLETELVERNHFKVRDQAGMVLNVVEYQILTRVVIDSSIRTTKGGMVYRLADGRDVLLLSETTFQVTGSDNIVTKV